MFGIKKVARDVNGLKTWRDVCTGQLDRVENRVREIIVNHAVALDFHQRVEKQVKTLNNQCESLILRVRDLEKKQAKTLEMLNLKTNVIEGKIEQIEEQIYELYDINKEIADEKKKPITGFEKATPWIERCPECKTPIFCGTCINCGFVQKQDIYNTRDIPEQ